MTHGEKMALLGKINMLYEVALEIQDKINKLTKQLKEVEDGGNKTSSDRSR
jgi:hypothetical protein